MLKNPEMLNRFHQKVKLEETLSDAGIMHTWSLYDTSDAALIDLGDKYELTLFVPYQHDHRKPQILLGELRFDEVKVISAFRGESTSDAAAIAFNAMVSKERHLMQRGLWTAIDADASWEDHTKRRPRCNEIAICDFDAIVDGC